MNMSTTTTPPNNNNNNWLGFSLSNHHYNTNLPSTGAGVTATSSDESHLGGLFQAFTTTPGRASVENGVEQTELSIFTDGGGGGPKLEDFLGGATTTQPTPLQPPLHLSHYPHHFPSNEIIYDLELKNIAAGLIFNGGFNNTSAHHEQSDDNNNNNKITIQQQQKQIRTQGVRENAPQKKPVENFGQRTSIYRGVTRHRWTGRYEAHLWDNSCRREGQSRKGRQVYLGGYDKEEKAARAYDLAALKYWGPTTTTNFLVTDYEKELVEMKIMTRQEFIASLRRKSSGFSRGASIYRGVTRHHQHGRWQARIGRVAGNKDLYLGTFSTQEEAAEAYDIAAIKFRGLNAVTNFDMSRYDIKSIASSNLPIGGITKSKNSESANSDSNNKTISDDRDPSSATSLTFASPETSNFNFALPIKHDPSTDYWSHLGYNTALPLNNPNSVYQTSNMDFSGSNGGGGYNVQRSGIGNTTSSSSMIPFATPIGISSGNNNEGGISNYSSWIYQTAKSNLSVFQTPIFGVE
jgi:AP2-like factor (ANT lineage)